MGGLGLIAAVLLLQKNLAVVQDSGHRKADLSIYLGLALIVSLFFAHYLNRWLYRSPVADLSLLDSFRYYGLTFYWGLIPFLCITYLLLRIFGYPIELYLNAIIPSITIFHAFGRIGCSFAGCCFGLEIPLPILGIYRFPAREIEALFLFILTVLFMTGVKHNRLLVYLASYPLVRFTLEFYRGDDRGKLFTAILSPSQEISIILFFSGIALLMIQKTTTISRISHP
jgi:phosphatidylglycerol:prolipoprotein diacylglycerol transferase